ncbi:hypothetical protein J6590_000891 [Homalodisca vitripennis]|nr:hypothetical protein J6590_000891 [Homalodisca vitripennis]
MKCLILLALAAAACADPVLLNYPYEGTNTYVPDQPYYRHYISDYPAVYRSVYPQYDASRAIFPAAAPLAVAAPAPVAVAGPAPVAVAAPARVAVAAPAPVAIAARSPVAVVAPAPVAVAAPTRVAVAAPTPVAIVEPAPVVTPEGYLADTPEVAILKAHHLNVIAKTLARS